MSTTERRLVETGRVCLCNFGKNVGKLCVIVNVIDGRRVLVDGPSTVNGLRRQMMPLARLSITQFKVDIAPGARIGTLSKAYKAADITGKWNATSWAQGMAKKAAKAKMTDMDRFKMMVARKTRATAVNKAFKKMVKK